MRSALLALVFGATVLLAGPAHADSYSYGGRGQRFELAVWLLGFNEGAGTEGWGEESAREFAGWAARFDAIIPAGAFVSLSRGVDDSEMILSIVVGKRSERHRIAAEPGFEEALGIVARRFRAKPPPARVGRIYTLQLFASRSEARARRFAESLEARDVKANGQLFYESCHPCSIPESKVLEDAGMYRVITGVFASPAQAGRALAEIRKRHKLSGFVRAL